jgi:hypothetical protein
MVWATQSRPQQTGHNGFVRRDLVTAPLAAAGLVGGYAVAVTTGSRPLGGLVLAAFALICIAIWIRRDGLRVTATLAASGAIAFALSHALGLVIGAWPAVLLTAAGLGVACWHLSDARRASARAGVRARGVDSWHA